MLLLVLTSFPKGGTQRAVVKVVQFAADRNAVGQGGHGDVAFRQPVGDIVGRRLAVYRGAGGKDDLGNCLPTGPAE